MSATALIIFLAVIFFGTIGVCIYFFSYKPKKSRNATRDRFGFMYVADVKHKSGLPFPNGLTIRVGYGEKGFVFIGDRTDVSVSMDKVVDVDYFLSTSKGTVARGAAHGRRLYGKNHKTLGTLAGAAAVSHYHLVVSYEAEGKIKKVVLDAEAGNMDCQRMQKHYKSNNFKPKKSIDLSPSSAAKPSGANTAKKETNAVKKSDSTQPFGPALDGIIRYVIGQTHFACVVLFEKTFHMPERNAKMMLALLFKMRIIGTPQEPAPTSVIVTMEQYEKISSEVKKAVTVDDALKIDVSAMGV